MTRIWNPRFACCCIVGLSLSIGPGCATHAPQTAAPATMPLTAHAAPAAADIQSAAVAPEKPNSGRLTGTLQLSPTANFPIDAEVRIIARYFDGNPVVIGQTFHEVRKWPIQFELQLPEDMARYDPSAMRYSSIRISARAELDGRTILVTEEKRYYIGPEHQQLDLVLMPAVE